MIKQNMPCCIVKIQKNSFYPPPSSLSPLPSTLPSQFLFYSGMLCIVDVVIKKIFTAGLIILHLFYFMIKIIYLDTRNLSL